MTATSSSAIPRDLQDQEPRFSTPPTEIILAMKITHSPLTNSTFSVIPAPYIATVFYNFFNSLAMVVNIIHLLVIWQMFRRNVRWGSPHYNTFVVIVGAMDLALSLERLTFASEFIRELSLRFPVLCVISAFTSQSILYSQSALMVVVSIDRLRALTDVRHYWTLVQVRYFKSLAFCIILIHFVYFTTVGSIFNYDKYTYTNIGPCVMSFATMPILSIVYGCVTLIQLTTIVSVYIGVMVKTVRSRSSTLPRRILERKAELTKTIGFLILVKIICWLTPVISLYGINLRNVSTHTFQGITWKITFIICLNSLLNPVMYGLAVHSYRKHIASLLCIVREKFAVKLGMKSKDDCTSNKSIELVPQQSYSRSPKSTSDTLEHAQVIIVIDE